MDLQHTSDRERSSDTSYHIRKRPTEKTFSRDLAQHGRTKKNGKQDGKLLLHQ
jgi:hypothetical protein